MKCDGSLNPKSHDHGYSEREKAAKRVL